MPILRILCYNGSLVTWTVVGLTTAQLFLGRINADFLLYDTDRIEHDAFKNTSVPRERAYRTVA
jgi:hypothetical protein